VSSNQGTATDARGVDPVEIIFHLSDKTLNWCAMILSLKTKNVMQRKTIDFVAAPRRTQNFSHAYGQRTLRADQLICPNPIFQNPRAGGVFTWT
jgi:hypothetical protein